MIASWRGYGADLCHADGRADGLHLAGSGARVVFVSNQAQLQKVLSIRKQTSVERIVVFDSLETADAIR